MLKQSGFGNLVRAQCHPLPGAVFPVCLPPAGNTSRPMPGSLGQMGFQVTHWQGYHPGWLCVSPRSQRWPEVFVTPQDWLCRGMELCHRGDMKQPVCFCHTFTVSGVTGSAESNPGHSRNHLPPEPPGSRDVTTSPSHFGAITYSSAKLSFHLLDLPTQNSSCSWPGHAQTHPVEELKLLTPNLSRE